ncbi:MAG: EamA family transporter [Alphaproteobacteria bacterium]|nr:EamA family transporter [Alphaproteobacteria bacterium]
MIVAIALFAAMDTCIKMLRDDYSALQILFFRMLFAAPPTLWLIHRDGGRRALETRRFGRHALRTALTLVALFCFFHSFRLMALAEVYAITYAAPLIVTALGVPMLGEKVGPRRWLAVLVGFAGVLIVLRPGAGLIGGGGAIALLGTTLLAVGMIMLRDLSRTETNAAIVFYFTILGGVISGLASTAVWVWPEGGDWLWLMAVGLIGGLGQIFVTEAFRWAPVAVVSPFQYTSLLWGVLFGYAVFGDTIDLPTLIGAGVIIASGVYIVRREAGGSG